LSYLGLVHVLAYLGYVRNGIVQYASVMLFYVCGKHERLYFRLGIIKT